MKTRIIQTRFWDDEFVVEASKIAKYLYIYLLTSQYINISGVFQLHDKKIMGETDLTPGELQKAKEELTNSGKVFFRGGWVYVKNAEKNNGYRNSPKNETAFNKELTLVPSHILPIMDSSTDTSMDSSHKSKIQNHKSERSTKLELNTEDLTEIAAQLNVPEYVVANTYQNLLDYIESTGKRYSNYKATVRGWVRKGVQEGKIKTEQPVVIFRAEEE